MAVYSDWKLRSYWTIWFFMLLLSVALLQLSLGANPVIVAIAICTIAASWFIIQWRGIANGGAIIVFAFITNTITIAILLKTILFQRLDCNLYNPFFAFSVVLIGTIEIITAFLIVDHIPLRHILNPCYNPRKLEFIGFASFAIGSLGWLLNQWFSKRVLDFATDNPGIGGFAIFRYLLTMSIIALTASAVMRSGGRRTVSGRLIIIAAMVGVMAFIDNSKMGIILPIFGYFLTSFYFSKRVAVKRLAVVLFGAVSFFSFVGPFVQYFRVLDIQGLSLSEKIVLIEDTVSNYSMGDLIAEARYWKTEVYSHGYYDYFGGDGRFQMLGGRVASIQQIDPVVASLCSNPFFGWKLVSDAVGSVIPRVLYPNKDIGNDAYTLTTSLGLQAPDEGIYPTVPLVAVSYAALGIPGLLVIPFVTFFVLFILFKAIGWCLEKNVFGIFFLCMIFPFIHEGSLQQYVNIILRGIPTLLVILIVINKVYKLSLLKRRRRIIHYMKS